MKVFKQIDEEHNNTLVKLLDIEKVKENAIDIKTPLKRDEITYKKCIKIDFIGIAATRLFDVVNSPEIYNQFVKIINNVENLNKEGYFVKIRLLFEYPYSISAYTRIIAEQSLKRSSITEDEFIRGVSLNDIQIDNNKFQASAYVTTQKKMLKQIQEILDALPKTLWNIKGVMNSFTLRFSPIQTYMRCLTINNDLFFDVYTLAKEKRFEDRCKQFCPIVHLNKQVDNSTFLAFEDHFRYIWDLDVTMDCEDATEYKANTSESLSEIKSPNKIKYNAKLKRLQYQNPSVPDKNFKVWHSRITSIMDRYCSNLSPTPDSESIFISCSWENKSPKKSAHELYNALYKDLCENTETPISYVTILNAALSENLAPELYRTMQNSTIGIVILTKDIESQDGKFYSKPNVYHELGYMMKHLTQERIMILHEKGVVIPTNIQDIINLEFETNKLCLGYFKIVEKIQQITLLDDKTIKIIQKSHLDRLNRELVKGEISNVEYKIIEESVNQATT